MKSLKLLFDIIAITILLIMPCTKSYSQVYELTSIEKLNTGDEIIIVNENSKVAMENVAISVNPKAISIESMLNEDKTEIHVTSNTNIQWIITKYDNATYSFNTPGTKNFLRAIDTAEGVSVGTKNSKTYEDTYSWDKTNSVLKATKTNGITDRYIRYSENINNGWRAYLTLENVTPKTIFFKRTKDIANIKFETDNFTIKAGDNFNAPNLIYTEGLTGITYSMECTPMYSSDVPENMATLNETTGEITLGNIPGTIVVTAYFSGNDTYGKASASYTINILDPDFVPANYSKITSTDQLYADGKYIIICEKYKKALSKISNNYYGNAVEINLDNGMVTIDTENDKDNPYEITLGGKPNAYTFTTLQGTIGWTKDYNKFNIKSNQEWKISFDENNNALIDNAANTSTARNLCYNKDKGDTSGPFRVYTQPESFSRVQFYRRNIICVGEEGYATFCNDMAYIMPKGVSGAVITSANTQNGVLTTNYCYPEGSIVPAYTPLLIKALTGTYDFLTVSSTDATTPNDNLLRGCKDIDENGKTYAGEGNYKYYILSHSKDGERFGFFWAATNGAAITYKAPYAYLAIKTSSNAPSMFSLDGDEYTTGIINIDNDKVFNNSTKFNISGQRVNKGYKGLIIMNNKKYLSK